MLRIFSILLALLLIPYPAVAVQIPALNTTELDKAINMVAIEQVYGQEREPAYPGGPPWKIGTKLERDKHSRLIAYKDWSYMKWFKRSLNPLAGNWKQKACKTAFIVSNIGDSSSTLSVMDRCPTCSELNPLLPDRPGVKSLAIFSIAIHIANAAVDAWQQDRSENKYQLDHVSGVRDAATCLQWGIPAATKTGAWIWNNSLERGK